MRIGLSGQRAARVAVSRAGLASLGLVLALALGACTTVEGTNALTDVGTFEREVIVRAGQTADLDVTLNPAPEEPQPEPQPAQPQPADVLSSQPRRAEALSSLSGNFASAQLIVGSPSAFHPELT